MTKEEALALYDTGWWKDVTPEKIVEFQLYEERLCMPFDKFQAAMEKVLDRPVFTHEFAELDKLCADYERVKKGEPTQGPDFSILEGKPVIVVGLDDTQPSEGQDQGPKMSM